MSCLEASARLFRVFPFLSMSILSGPCWVEQKGSLLPPARWSAHQAVAADEMLPRHWPAGRSLDGLLSRPMWPGQVRVQGHGTSTEDLDTSPQTRRGFRMGLIPPRDPLRTKCVHTEASGWVRNLPELICCFLFCVRRKAASQTDKPADKKEDESQTVSKSPSHPHLREYPGRLSGPTQALGHAVHLVHVIGTSPGDLQERWAGGQEEDDRRACGALTVIPTARHQPGSNNQSHPQPCGTPARQPHQLCDWQKSSAVGQAVHVLGPQRWAGCGLCPRGRGHRKY